MKPPALARALVRIFAHAEDRDFLFGDLDDRFRDLARSRGLPAAKRWYWRQAVSAVPWSVASHRVRIHPTSWAPWCALREASRSLARTPIFTGVSILSVGIGIGLATSVFAVAHAIFFKPPPYHDAARLVQIWDTQRPGSHQRSDYLTPARMLAWVHTPMRYLVGVSGSAIAGDMILEGAGPATHVDARGIAGDWFGTLGTPAALGRVLTAQDERPGAGPAAVLSWTLWQQRFDGRPDALGRVIRLSETAFTVVGVMPQAFEPGEVVWVPAECLPTGEAPAVYLGVARLRPDATQQDARQEIERRSAAQVAADSVRWGSEGATTVPMPQASSTGNRSTLWILAGVVAAVLLIGLVNLTTLFLVRAQERSVSLAVRASLGASTWQLGRGLVVEALLVGTGGAVMGMLLAVWGSTVAAALVSTTVPPLGAASALVAVGLGILVTVIVGLEPVRRLHALDVRDLLQRRTGGATSTRGERRSRDLMVGVQVAACVVLVATLALFSSTYEAYKRIDPGYDARRIVRAIPDYQIAHMDAAAQWALARQVAQRVRHDPAVRSVALWTMMLEPWPPNPAEDPVIEGVDPSRKDVPQGGWTYEVDPGFFRAIGIRLVDGRPFVDADNAGAEPIVIVTKDGADAWWPGENPLGRRIKFGRDEPWMTVVGVVDTTSIIGVPGRGFRVIMIRHKARHMPVPPSIFVPASQWTTLPRGWRWTADADETEGVSVAVGAVGDPARAERALRGAFATLAPDLPLRAVETMYDEQMHSWEAEQIIPPGRYVGAGAVLGLLLAVLGIVGVVADAVTRRRREIGLRVALGARPARILGAVARESLLTGVLGLAAGLAAVVALRGIIVKRFVEIEVRWIAPSLTDPRLLVEASVLVLTLVLLAALLTARRALRVDPAEALRSQ